MNSSAYDPNIVHQEHPNVQHTSSFTGHTHQHNVPHGLGSFFLPSNTTLPMSEQQQPAQLQLSNVGTCTNNVSGMTTQSPPSTTSDAVGIFSSRQIPINNVLGKNFFNATVHGIQAPAHRFFGGITPTVTTSAASNSVQQTNAQQHQQGNTILITNNFSTHQFGHPSNNFVEPGTSTPTGVINSIPSTASDSTECYHNGNASNIRIITTLPSVLHHHQKQQQHQQNAYNIGKNIEATARDEVIQLPEFYHTPHSQSTYAQHMSPSLSTPFSQQHFSATATSPASVHISQSEPQPHPFCMSFTNDSDSSLATTNNLTSVTKLIPALTEECCTDADTVTTSPALITSSATTTNSNSTLVLDRINICINNHYSDSLGPTNTLCTTTLDTNTTTGNKAITSNAHTYTIATHAPQQPSPIIPAIHHKVVLDSVGCGSSSGIHSDLYTNKDSALVIHEPDSTTTTPHTPPTTPENSSSPPLSLNLISTRNVPQSVADQIIVDDLVTENKSNFTISTQITDSSVAMKAISNKVAEKHAASRIEKAFATITQSIDLIDEEESEYVSSNVESETHSGTGAKGTKAEQVLDDSIMEIVEIDDSEMQLSSSQIMRTKNTSKCGGTCGLTPQENRSIEIRETSDHVDLKVSTLDSPQSPSVEQTVRSVANKTTSSMTLLTPPTPNTSPSTSQVVSAEENVVNSFTSSPDIFFSMGEDVFIRKEDGRQYLGTVIGSSAIGELNKLQKIQYLIRFDDNSELWCGSKEMRRLESNSGNSGTHMCVACKRKQIKDVVEICEDCRRGYHRSCTRETTPGSGVWWCLRCSKPMKDRPKIGSKIGCKSLTHHNSYRNYMDAKTSASSLKRRDAADVYEFHVEDNEIFTSDDEIPIKHIIDKVRKSKESTQNLNLNGLKENSTKNHNICDSILCDPIAVIADENANDANSLKEMSHTLKKENLDEKNVTNNTQSSFATNVKRGNTNKIEISAKNDDCLHPSNVAINSVYSVHNKVTSAVIERSSRKRKAFTLSNSYKEVAAEAASKRYDSSRICDSSSDENSSSSRGTSLDVIIPPPKNFLGLNNPFRMITPKKNSVANSNVSGVQSLLNFNRSGTMIKSSIFNTTALDFSSKLAALKSAGMFPNLSTSNLARAAGQPRTVRTIKRRLSAKDITIGPNQEVRRRRTRRLSSNVEVISTTTINPIPSNFFPIHAKDLLPAHTQLTATRVMTSFNKQQQLSQRQVSSISSSSSASSSPPGSVAYSVDVPVEVKQQTKPSHGRRLRQRPQQKNSPANSRRSSVSSASTASSTNSSSNITLAALQQQQHTLLKSNNKNSNNMNTNVSSSMQDLKQSVKEYFGGVVNRIESGEQFCIRAKRQLANGQTQYLIEWGDVATVLLQGHLNSNTSPITTPVTIEQEQ